MQIPLILTNFLLCYIWMYISVFIVHGLFHILRYFVEIHEKRMRNFNSEFDSDSDSEYIENDQHYENDDEYLNIQTITHTYFI